MSQRTFERESRRRQQAKARRATLKRRRAGLAAGAVGAAVMLSPAAANAATFEVNTLTDDGTGTCATDCTLRDAVALANATPDDADEITFANGLNGTIYLAHGQLSLTSAITITGPSADELTISGKASDEAPSNSRVFSVSGSGDARISGLTVTDGNGTANSDGGAGDGQGGGISVDDGKLTLTDSVVTDNATDNGGSSWMGAGGGIGVGGGEATITGTEVSSNSVNALFASGGGIANTGGTLDVHDSSVTENEVNGFAGYGGGVAASGATTIEGSHVDHNVNSGEVSSTGGGISSNVKYASFETTTLLRAAGPNQLSVSDSTISANEADDGGGLSADFSTDKFSAADGVIIARTTIDGNVAGNAGGGVAVSNQQEDNAFTVRDTTVSNNNVEEEVTSGDDPETEENEGTTTTEPTGTGGGFEFDDVGGTTLMSNSTVSGNSAGTGGGIHGGNSNFETASRSRALRSAEKELPPVAARMARQQRLTEEGGEGDEPATPTGSLLVSNTTVAANDASETGGGVALDQNATDGNNPTLTSTIVGDNSADGSDDADLSTSGDTETFDLAYSLIETPGSATVNADPAKPMIIGKDPALGGLTDNGGPTKTMLPGASSPAIDAGDADDSLTGPSDQRVLARFFRTVDRLPVKVSDDTDIGAVELPAQTAASTPPASNPPRPLTPSAVPTTCGRRIISLVDARVRGRKVVLSGLVGSKLYGKKVTIQTDPKGARASGFAKTSTVTASKTTGKFTASVPKPSADDYITVRYRAVAGRAKSAGLKLPQSLTSRSVKSAKGTITVKGKVKTSLLGKRNKVTVRSLVCGRYRTVGSVRPDSKGNYKVTFKDSGIRGVALYRAESKVLVKPGAKRYVPQFARAIAIRTTKQTG